MYYVYILRDSAGKIYTGYSNNLKSRYAGHRHGKVATTKSYTKPSLIWYCAFASKKRALDFEKYLKAGSGHAFAKRHLM
jgi:predicted GIY-YIG superfamily endonuclease